MKKTTVFLLILFLSIQLASCFSSSPKKLKHIYYKTKKIVVEPSFDYKSIKTLLIVNGQKKIPGDSAPYRNKKSTLAIAKALKEKKQYIISVWQKGNYGPRGAVISHGKRNNIDGILFVRSTRSDKSVKKRRTRNLESVGGYDPIRKAWTRENMMVERNYILKKCDMKMNVEFINLKTGKTRDWKNLYGSFSKERRAFLSGKTVSSKFCQKALLRAANNTISKLVPHIKKKYIRCDLGSELIEAIRLQKTDEIKRLLKIFKEKGITLNQYFLHEKFKKGLMLPLNMALESQKNKERLIIIDMLIKNGADVNYSKQSYQNPIRTARSIEDAEFLIKMGAKINGLDSSGNPVIINLIPAKNTNLKLTEFYISRTTDLNARSKRTTRTALHIAISNCNYEVTKLLIKYGADVNIKSKYGGTVLKIVNNAIRRRSNSNQKKNKFRKIKKLLIKNGAHE